MNLIDIPSSPEYYYDAVQFKEKQKQPYTPSVGKNTNFSSLALINVIHAHVIGTRKMWVGMVVVSRLAWVFTLTRAVCQ